jgi:hypothetical protein
MRLCSAKMQDREEEGCWSITIGYVFIQEPDESSPTCTSQESQLKFDYVDCSMGREGVGEGGGVRWEGGRHRGNIIILKITKRLSFYMRKITMLNRVKFFDSFLIPGMREIVLRHSFKCGIIMGRHI